MNKIKFKVLGKKWVMRLAPNKKFTKKYGDVLAVTIIHKNKIILSKDGCTLLTIVHELVHAYMAEICTDSTNMSKDDAEEIFAELMARRGKEILKLGKELYKQVEKLINVKNT